MVQNYISGFGLLSSSEVPDISSLVPDILDSCVLPTFGEGPFLFPHDVASVHKMRSIKTWFAEFVVDRRQ